MSLRVPAGAVVAFALVVAACGSSGGSTERATTSSSSTSSAPTTPGPSTSTVAPSTTATPSFEPAPIEWSPCDGDECARVEVPLDHDDPGGRTISLAVRRRPADGERIGALFFNFGGPGSPAPTLLPRFPVPADIRAHFDLVAVDPRGVGGSSPLDCGVDPQTLYSVDPTVDDQQDARALVDISERYAEDCASTQGELLAHVGTWDVARDLDLVRAAMGDEQLSFIGFSYGTSIGQAYAELFPERVRSIVLDGVVDPAATGVELAVEQARGFETALANWAAACPRRSTCSLDDPVGAVEQVLRDAETGIPSTSSRPLGAGEVAVGLALPLYSEALWPSLDRAVADAVRGDGGGMVALADQYEQLVDFPVYFAVSCVDTTWPATPDALFEAAKDAAQVAPHFGEAITTDYLRCAVWPVEPDPLGAIRAPGTPPILVVSTTGDPATPYENGVTVAQRLASAALLTNQGEGHTIVFQGSACVDRVVVNYLLDQAVPGDGARCQ